MTYDDDQRAREIEEASRSHFGILVYGAACMAGMALCGTLGGVGGIIGCAIFFVTVGLFWRDAVRRAG